MMQKSSIIQNIGSKKIIVDEYSANTNILNKGVKKLQLNNYNQALHLFKKAWTISSFRKAALNNISVTYAYQNNYHLANFYIEKAQRKSKVYSDTLVYNHLVIDGLSGKINFSNSQDYYNAPTNLSNHGLYRNECYNFWSNNNS